MLGPSRTHRRCSPRCSPGTSWGSTSRWRRRRRRCRPPCRPSLACPPCTHPAARAAERPTAAPTLAVAAECTPSGAARAARAAGAAALVGLSPACSPSARHPAKARRLSALVYLLKSTRDAESPRLLRRRWEAGTSDTPRRGSTPSTGPTWCRSHGAEWFKEPEKRRQAAKRSTAPPRNSWQQAGVWTHAARLARGPGSVRALAGRALQPRPTPRCRLL